MEFCLNWAVGKCTKPFFRHLWSWEIRKTKVHQKPWKSCMRSWKPWFFHVHYDYCNCSASKMSRKVVLYIFQQPRCAKSKNGDVFYSSIRIGGLIFKTVAWYHFVLYMKCNQVIKWYQASILSMNFPILILEETYHNFWILHN